MCDLYDTLKDGKEVTIQKWNVDIHVDADDVINIVSYQLM